MTKQQEHWNRLNEEYYELMCKKNQDYCLSPDTKVLTEELLWIPIKDILRGMVLVGFDETSESENIHIQYRRMYKPSTVEKVSEVVLPSYKIILENGDELIASSEHPWLCINHATSKWVTTEQLIVKGNNTYHAPYSRLVKPLDVWEQIYNYDSGYLAAAFDGEGSLSQLPDYSTKGKRHKRGTTFSFSFAQKNNKMLKYVMSILDEMGINYSVRAKSQNIDVQELYIKKPRREAIRLIGQVRPKRIIDNINLNFGMVDLRRSMAVIGKEFIGDTKLIAIQTSTKTFLANGYATHNSPANIIYSGVPGVLIRIWDKTCRLFSLFGVQIPNYLTIFDTHKNNIFADVDMFESYGDISSATSEKLKKSIHSNFADMERECQVDFSKFKEQTPQNEPILDAFKDLEIYSRIGHLRYLGLWGR